MKVEHEMQLDGTEMMMMRWVCGFTLRERKKKSAELRDLMRLDPVSFVRRVEWWICNCIDGYDT